MDSMMTQAGQEVFAATWVNPIAAEYGLILMLRLGAQLLTAKGIIELAFALAPSVPYVSWTQILGLAFLLGSTRTLNVCFPHLILILVSFSG